MGKSINLLRSLLPLEQISQDVLIGSAEEHNKRDLMILVMPILDITRQDRHIGESYLLLIITSEHNVWSTI